MLVPVLVLVLVLVPVLTQLLALVPVPALAPPRLRRAGGGAPDDGWRAPTGVFRVAVCRGAPRSAGTGTRAPERGHRNAGVAAQRPWSLQLVPAAARARGSAWGRSACSKSPAWLPECPALPLDALGLGLRVQLPRRANGLRVALGASGQPRCAR
ncbi:hypothetical protein GCM10009805_07810 [Leucobacter chromiireducens subsp. solipictus]